MNYDICHFICNRCSYPGCTQTFSLKHSMDRHEKRSHNNPFKVKISSVNEVEGVIVHVDMKFVCILCFSSDNVQHENLQNLIISIIIIIFIFYFFYFSLKTPLFISHNQLKYTHWKTKLRIPTKTSSILIHIDQ